MNYQVSKGPVVIDPIYGNEIDNRPILKDLNQVNNINILQPAIMQYDNMPLLDKRDLIEDHKGPSLGYVMFLVFLLIWMIIGILAFIMSLICFGYSGSFGEKLFGFIISLAFGPFYWIFYIANGNYCTSFV